MFKAAASGYTKCRVKDRIDGICANGENKGMTKTRRVNDMHNTQNVRRGDIYYADLSPVVGSEQGGLRPVLIIQNDVGNRYSPTVIAAAITSRMGKTRLPTHIDVRGELCPDPSHPDAVPNTRSECGLARDSVILLEQIRTLDKRRLREKLGHLDDETMRLVNDALGISFGLIGAL